MNYSEATAPFGTIGLRWDANRLLRLELAPSPTPAAVRKPAPAWISAQLDAYFADPSHRIACDTDIDGTRFQRRVWDCIAEIPSGNTMTYGSIADELGTSARAVGNACRANPVPLRVPCHRVVAATGLGGFAGDRSGRLVQIKRWLLGHESACGFNGRAR